MRYLAESERYKVISIFENVYLKDKESSKNVHEYEESDTHISSVYGDPDSAVITSDERYVVIAGCGINVYSIPLEKHQELYAEPDDIHWTEGIYQSAEDTNEHVRFVSFNKSNQVRLYKLNLKTNEKNEL